MKAAVQDALAEEVLHHRVRAPQRGLDAVEHDLLDLGSGSRYPVGKGVKQGAVTIAVHDAGDPQHAEVRVDSRRVQKRQRIRHVAGALAGVSVTL